MGRWLTAHSPGGLSIRLLSPQLRPGDQIQEGKTHIH